MRIGERSFGEHFRLLVPLLIFIAAVGILRLIFYELLGFSWIVRVMSVTVATAVSVLLATFLIYRKRFGGYANVLVSTFLLVSWGHIFTVLMILLAIWSGGHNVFTAPEYSHPLTHAQHIIGHLTFGIGIGNLIGGGLACLFFLLLKSLHKSSSLDAA